MIVGFGIGVFEHGYGIGSELEFEVRSPSRQSLFGDPVTLCREMGGLLGGAVMIVQYDR